MPTHNPRISVTVRPEQYELLSRIARLQKRSRAALLVELLETVTPVLERVCVVGEAAQRAQVQAKEGLRDSVERAEAAILPHVVQAMEQFDFLVEDAVRGFEQGGASAGTAPAPRPVGKGSTPVGVTTGVRSPGGTGVKGRGERPSRRVSARPRKGK